MKNKKINFNGKKVVIIVGAMLLGTVLLNPIGTSSQLGGSNPKEFSYSIAEKIKEDKLAVNDEKKSDEKSTEKTEDSSTQNANKGNNTVTNNSTSSNSNSKSSNSTSNNKSSSNNNTSTTNNTQNNTNTTNNTSNNQTNNNTPSNPPPSQQQQTPVENKTMVTVYRSSGAVLNIELEEYLIGVVAAEMPSSFQSEALKAQAVAARTYTLKAIDSGKKLTDTVATQAYSDNTQLKSLWGSSYDTYYNKIKSAVNDTKGQVITYNGSLIEAVFHSTSNGYTESAKEVWGNDIAYLQVVESKWDKDVSGYLKTVDKEFNVVSLLLGMDINTETPVEVISRDVSGRVSSIKINNKLYSGIDIRNIFGLRSADFDMVFGEDKIIFTTRGYGHGVGMSQYGSNGMAKEGYSYKQILTYYYKGVSIITK